MKKLILLALLLAVIGCAKAPQKPAVVTIDNYSVSPEEFEAEFRDSPMAKRDTPEARKQFMETLINRKLILLEAQKLGLDKQAAFLNSIERFWEQSLLKVCVDYKTQQMTDKVVISDFAVEQAYKNLVAEGKADKTYEEMYRQLKWELTRAKEAQLMDEWLKEMRARARITENYDLLQSK